MDALAAIHTRRSIKAFNPNFEIPKEDEQKIFDAAMHAPTSFNIQHWRAVVLRDKALREKIRKEYGNDQSQMTDASLLFLLTADTNAWKKSPERYWSGAPQEVSDMLVGWMKPFHEGREWLQRDEAQRSIGIVAQTIMLAATGLGYQSCPMIGFEIEKVAELIGLPSDHVMGPMIAVGKGTKEPWPKQGLLPKDELFIDNKFA